MHQSASWPRQRQGAAAKWTTKQHNQTEHRREGRNHRRSNEDTEEIDLTVKERSKPT
jgi:hypothetical protein